MSLYTAADILEEHNPKYADNLRAYYRYCRDHDITLSHAFIQPYACKMSGQQDAAEDTIAAKVVEINDQGMIMTGAFMMATQEPRARKCWYSRRLRPRCSMMSIQPHSPLRFRTICLE